MLRRWNDEGAIGYVISNTIKRKYDSPKHILTSCLMGEYSSRQSYKFVYTGLAETGMLAER